MPRIVLTVVAYLQAFLNARKRVMLLEDAHRDLSRISTEQQVFLDARNLDLDAPLAWKTYGDSYTIRE